MKICKLKRNSHLLLKKRKERTDINHLREFPVRAATVG